MGLACAHHPSAGSLPGLIRLHATCIVHQTSAQPGLRVYRRVQTKMAAWFCVKIDKNGSVVLDIEKNGIKRNHGQRVSE